MENRKPTGSLASGLLARKGSARPAMRSQFLSSFGKGASHASADDLEDLGWNDMGHDSSSPEEYDARPSQSSQADLSSPEGAREQQEALKERFGRPIGFDSSKSIQSDDNEDTDTGEGEDISPPVHDTTDSRHETSGEKSSLLTMSHSSTNFYRGGRERSFTLRMSETRHSRLKSACIEQNCSAQLLVTKAVDHYLNMIS